MSVEKQKGYQTEKEKEHEFKLYGHPGADL